MERAPFSKRVVTLHFDSEYDIDRAECAEIVRGPGKFEGEPIYLPYVWNRTMLDNMSDTEESDKAYKDYCESIGVDPFDLEAESPEVWMQFDRFVYRVTMEDRLIFPELEHVDRVVCWESDQGFVYSEERELAPSIDTIFVGI